MQGTKSRAKQKSWRQSLSQRYPKRKSEEDPGEVKLGIRALFQR